MSTNQRIGTGWSDKIVESKRIDQNPIFAKHQHDLDLYVLIGRFEPFHNGHLQLLIEGAKKARKLLVIVGSSFSSRTVKNPFTHIERKQMIEQACQSAGIHPERLCVDFVADSLYNENQWLRNVQSLVKKYTPTDTANPRIGLGGFNKDESSYYLKSFAYLDATSHMHIEHINATDIRQHYLHADFSLNTPAQDFLKTQLPTCVFNFMLQFSKTDPYALLRQEFEFLNLYRSQFDGLKHIPSFQTVDTVLIRNGHILLTRRTSFPGKGLWALPGGFCRDNLTLAQSAKAVLLEKTKIKIPHSILEDNYQKCPTHCFDHPGRSLRGRTFSYTFFIQLNDGTQLDTLKSSQAQWIPLCDLPAMRDQFFEDHASIIDYFVPNL